VKTPQLKI